MPRRRAGEALIRVTLAGICATDLEILRGYRSLHGIPGHEFVGTVVESDNPQWMQRRVVGEINVPCGRCDMCLWGWPKHCRNRSAIGIQGRDGAMAEYLTLPESNLHQVPDTVSDECAVFTEPLAAALEILGRVYVGPNQKIVVLGDGKLGLLVAQVIAYAGGRPIVVGHHAEKLAILERLGISTRMDTASLERSADVVVECTGHPAGFEEACRLVRPRGHIVLKSTYVSRVEVDISRLVVDEIHVIGSRCGPFEPALRLLAYGQIEVMPLIDSVYPLERGIEAFQRAGQKGVLKVLIRP